MPQLRRSIEVDHRIHDRGQPREHRLCALAQVLSSWHDCRHCPGAQLEHAKRDQIEDRARMGASISSAAKNDIVRRQRPSPPRPRICRARGEHDGGRPDQIELLLDGQRPGVQQRLQRRGSVEVTGLTPEQDIGQDAAENSVVRPSRAMSSGAKNTNPPARSSVCASAGNIRRIRRT